MREADAPKPPPGTRGTSLPPSRAPHPPPTHTLSPMPLTADEVGDVLEGARLLAVAEQRQRLALERLRERRARVRVCARGVAGGGRGSSPGVGLAVAAKTNQKKPQTKQPNKASSEGAETLLAWDTKLDTTRPSSSAMRGP